MPRYWVIAPYHADKPEIWDRVWSYNLDQNLISIGWRELGDVSSLNEPQLKERIDHEYAAKLRPVKTRIYTTFRDFYQGIKVDDVIIARRGRKTIAGIGKVTRVGYYEDKKNAAALGVEAYPNNLDVQWERLPRNKTFSSIVFAIDTLYEIREQKFRDLIETDYQSEVRAGNSVRKPTSVNVDSPSAPPERRTSDLDLVDPVPRIGTLQTANRRPVTVTPDSKVSVAITNMQLHGSPLPVMQGNREVKGLISWQSICVNAMIHNKECRLVKDCMERDVAIVWDDEPIRKVLRTIAEKEVVLVQARSNREIIGLVRASDFSNYFYSLGEPFFLIWEIEDHVRLLIAHASYSLSVLTSVRGLNDEGRKIESALDLNFGDYLRLFQDENNWRSIRYTLDRKTFLSALDGVRRIRNDVMHFRPELISEQEIEILRDTVDFMRSLKLWDAGASSASLQS